ncbi:MAG: ACP S-malonyltransferase [Candidatus Dormibacteria bacterium]
MIAGPRTALIFPGQGVQAPGMWARIMESPRARALLERARHVLGSDELDALTGGDEAALTLTRHTQPAVFICSLGLLEVARERWEAGESPAPDVQAVAGHSLGEYTAAVAAGALTFEDGLRLVALRGRLMEEAGARVRGGMTAVVGLTPTLVRQMCRAVRRRTGALIAVSGLNGPLQVTVGGELAGIEELEREAQERKARAIRVKISIPAHTPLMASASVAMQAALRETHFSDPVAPLISSVTGAALATGESVRRALEIQMLRPVRWVHVARTIGQMKLEAWDVGPGEVVAGLTQRLGVTAQSLIKRVFEVAPEQSPVSAG